MTVAVPAPAAHDQAAWSELAGAVYLLGAGTARHIATPGSPGVALCGTTRTTVDTSGAEPRLLCRACLTDWL